MITTRAPDGANKLAKLKRHAIIGVGGLSASYYKKKSGGHIL